MAKRSNELERLAHVAVEHQARHAQKKAAAFLGVLISNAQHDGSTSDGLSRKQRELIEEFRACWGWSEEEAREHLRLLGG